MRHRQNVLQQPAGERIEMSQRGRALLQGLFVVLEQAQHQAAQRHVDNLRLGQVRRAPGTWRPRRSEFVPQSRADRSRPGNHPPRRSAGFQAGRVCGPIGRMFLIDGPQLVELPLPPAAVAGRKPGPIRPDHAGDAAPGIAKPAGEVGFAVTTGGTVSFRRAGRRSPPFGRASDRADAVDGVLTWAWGGVFRPGFLGCKHTHHCINALTRLRPVVAAGLTISTKTGNLVQPFANEGLNSPDVSWPCSRYSENAALPDSAAFSEYREHGHQNPCSIF